MASLDPSKQIDLKLRKRLAAAVLVARCCDQFAQAEEGLIDNGIAKAYANGVAQRFFEQLIYDEDSTSPKTIPLVDVLKEVKLEWTKEANEQISLLHKRFLDGIEQFDCQQCGPDKKKACNTANDALLFKAKNGGRCLNFIIDLIEKISKTTINQYKTHTGKQFNTKLLPKLLVETTPWPDGHTSTLDIDGELVPPSEIRDEAILRIKWPNDTRDLQESLRCLPYLIFHELFVHWPQGICTNNNFVVDTDCNFTEGAVDAVACMVLLDLLDSPANNLLPELIQLLRESFRASAQRYHDDRTNWKASQDPDEMIKPSYQIGMARYYGRVNIYKLLKDIYSRNYGKNPKKTTHQIILALNLQLTRDQRKEFYGLMYDINKFANILPFRRDSEIMRAFDEYLISFDPQNLLTILEAMED